MNIIKLRYSIEPRDIYVKGYGYLSFAKNIGNKYSQNFFDRAKKSANEARKIASKRAVQKIAEAAGDLISNKIADKITCISKKTVKELPINNEDVEIIIHKKIYISPEERQQIIDELRLVPKN